MVSSPSTSPSQQRVCPDLVLRKCGLALCSFAACLALTAGAQAAGKQEKKSSTSQKPDSQTNAKKADAKKSDAKDADKAKEEAPPEEPEAEEVEPEDPKSEEEGAAGEEGATAAASATAAAMSVGLKNTIVFIDVSIRSDNGTFVSRDTVGRIVNEEITDVRSTGPMVQFGFLTKLFGDFRAGGSFGYGFNYTLNQRLTPEQEEQEVEPFHLVLGQLQTLEARIEWAPRLAERVYLAVGPRGGMSWLNVGGDLEEATAAVEESHVVRNPRLGWLVGGDAGVRFLVLPWLSIRGGAGYAYMSQSLLKATRRGDAADSSRLLRTSGTRFTGTLGLEANF